jgi:mRNA-degrading endonuclease RelE of RelBE toxin-antitoxin system
MALELPRLCRTFGREVPEKGQSREGYRLRGDYRIIYRVDNEAREVLGAEVWRRQRGYR